MDWSGYRYFLAVAETGSLSAAARVLKVSQPTVGRQISTLEAALETKLFDRMPQGYQLTSAGAAIVDLARNIEESAIAIKRRIGGQDQSLSGRVCIAAAEGLATYWLAPRIPELKRRYPEIEVDLKVGMASLDMMRREADIALRIGDPVSEELVGRCVTKVRFGLFGSEAYLSEQGEPSTLDDLARHAVIGSTGEVAGLPQVRELEARSRAASVPFSCNSLLAQFIAMRHGLGLLALPLYMASNASEARRVLAEEFEISLDLWLLTHSDLKETARVRVVIDHLCAEIRRTRPLFEGRSASGQELPEEAEDNATSCAAGAPHQRPLPLLGG